MIFVKTLLTLLTLLTFLTLLTLLTLMTLTLLTLTSTLPRYVVTPTWLRRHPLYSLNYIVVRNGSTVSVVLYLKEKYFVGKEKSSDKFDSGE